MDPNSTFETESPIMVPNLVVSIDDRVIMEVIKEVLQRYDPPVAHLHAIQEVLFNKDLRINAFQFLNDKNIPISPDGMVSLDSISPRVEGILIIRDLDSSTDVGEIIDFFQNLTKLENGETIRCPSAKSLKKGPNNTCFVTFATDSDAKLALEMSKTQLFNGEKLLIRLKTESQRKYNPQPHFNLYPVPLSPTLSPNFNQNMIFPPVPSPTQAQPMYPAPMSPVGYGPMGFNLLPIHQMPTSNSLPRNFHGNSNGNKNGNRKYPSGGSHNSGSSGNRYRNSQYHGSPRNDHSNRNNNSQNTSDRMSSNSVTDPLLKAPAEDSVSPIVVNNTDNSEKDEAASVTLSPSLNSENVESSDVEISSTITEVDIDDLGTVSTESSVSTMSSNSPQSNNHHYRSSGYHHNQSHHSSYYHNGHHSHGGSNHHHHHGQNGSNGMVNHGHHNNNSHHSSGHPSQHYNNNHHVRNNHYSAHHNNQPAPFPNFSNFYPRPFGPNYPNNQFMQYYSMMPYGTSPVMSAIPLEYGFDHSPSANTVVISSGPISQENSSSSTNLIEVQSVESNKNSSVDESSSSPVEITSEEYHSVPVDADSVAVECSGDEILINEAQSGLVGQNQSDNEMNPISEIAVTGDGTVLKQKDQTEAQSSRKDSNRRTNENRGSANNNANHMGKRRDYSNHPPNGNASRGRNAGSSDYSGNRSKNYSNGSHGYSANSNKQKYGKEGQARETSSAMPSHISKDDFPSWPLSSSDAEPGSRSSNSSTLEFAKIVRKSMESSSSSGAVSSKEIDNNASSSKNASHTMSNHSVSSSSGGNHKRNKNGSGEFNNRPRVAPSRVSVENSTSEESNNNGTVASAIPVVEITPSITVSEPASKTVSEPTNEVTVPPKTSSITFGSITTTIDLSSSAQVHDRKPKGGVSISGSGEETVHNNAIDTASSNTSTLSKSVSNSSSIVNSNNISSANSFMSKQNSHDKSRHHSSNTVESSSMTTTTNDSNTTFASSSVVRDASTSNSRREDSASVTSIATTSVPESDSLVSKSTSGKTERKSSDESSETSSNTNGDSNTSVWGSSDASKKTFAQVIRNRRQ